MLLMSWISIILNCYTRSSNFDYPLESCTRENCIIVLIAFYSLALACFVCDFQLLWLDKNNRERLVNSEPSLF